MGGNNSRSRTQLLNLTQKEKNNLDMITNHIHFEPFPDSTDENSWQSVMRERRQSTDDYVKFVKIPKENQKICIVPMLKTQNIDCDLVVKYISIFYQK